MVEARTWRHSPVCSQAVDHLWSPLHAIGFFLHVVAEFVSRERHSRESKVQLQALDTAMLFGYVAQSTRSASGPIHPSLLHVVREEAWQTLGTASCVLIFRPMSTQKAAVRQEKSAHRPRSTWRAREAAAPEAAAWMPARWVASSSSSLLSGCRDGSTCLRREQNLRVYTIVYTICTPSVHHVYTTCTPTVNFLCAHVAHIPTMPKYTHALPSQQTPH